MRHSHIGNTEVYVHTDINYLRRFYAKHPRSAVVADDQAVPDVSRRAKPQPQHRTRLSPRSRRLAEFAGARARVERMDHTSVRSFLVRLQDAGISRNSVYRKLAAIKSFYRWVDNEGLR